MENPAAHQASKAINAWIVEHAGTKKLKILVMVNTRKASHVKKAISPKLPTDGRGRAPTTTLSKLIKKLNEENQPPGGWYKPQATSLKPEASSDER